MNDSNTATIDIAPEEVIVTLTDFPAHKPSPVLPILAQGTAAAILDLINARAQLLPISEHNELARSQIEGQLLLLQATSPSNIRSLNSSIPSPESINNYKEDASIRLRKIQDVLLYQQHVLSTIDTLIQRKTTEGRPTDNLDQESTTSGSKSNGSSGSNSKDNSTFVKVPSTVDRFGTTGSRNAKEFLRTFLTQIEAFSSFFDPKDGNTLGRLLSQVIDDVNLKNAFAKDFVASVNAKHPAKLTVDELSSIFMKHCGKTSDNLETSRRLLSMAPKAKESFVDYGKRASLEMQRSGTADHCPAITSYLEGTIPPPACSTLRLWYLVDHLYTLTGHIRPKIPTESFNEWYNATLYMEGNVDDYGTLRFKHDQASDTTTDNNKRLWSGNMYNRGFKRPRTETTSNSSLTNTAATNVIDTTPANKTKSCDKCGWANHDTAQCKAPHCAPCRTHHFDKHCPQRKGTGSNSQNTGVRNNATYVRGDILVDALPTGSLDNEYDQYNLDHQLYIYNEAIKASFNNLNEDNRPVVPIYFKGTLYQALLDTGCTHTIIDNSVAAAHNITIHP
ncbi:hypothetical protein BGZ65_005531, partial [Modicella reniformis]